MPSLDSLDEDPSHATKDNFLDTLVALDDGTNPIVDCSDPAPVPQEDTSLASMLEKHRPFVNLLRRLLTTKTHEWPADDKCGDQLPPNYDPYNAAHYGTTSKASKRTLDEDEDAIGTNVSKKVRSSYASSSKPLPALDLTQAVGSRTLRSQGSVHSAGSNTLVGSRSSSKGKSVAR